MLVAKQENKRNVILYEMLILNNSVYKLAPVGIDLRRASAMQSAK